jgi:uncharacterized protein YciI
MRKLISYFDEKIANTMIVHNQDIGKQEEENRQLLVGGNPPVMPWHKHPIHVRVMIDWMNGPEFGELPPQEQSRIYQSHLQPHLDYLQKAFEDQQATAMQGGPFPATEGGGGGQPAAPFQQGTGPATIPEAIDQTLETAVQPNQSQPPM